VCGLTVVSGVAACASVHLGAHSAHNGCTLHSWPMPMVPLFYIYILSFLIDISPLLIVELTPRGPLLLTLSPLSLISDLVHGRLCPLLGCSPLYPFVLSCFTFYWPRTYDNLRLRIEGESPDGAPHMIISKSYRSMSRSA